MIDRIGTVRVSPDGIVAVRAETTYALLPNDQWLASSFRDRRPAGLSKSYWLSQDDVSDWEIVYTPPFPPYPVGTVLRRDTSIWQVAVMRDEGWFVVSNTTTWSRQAIDPHDGSWEIIHGSSGQ